MPSCSLIKGTQRQPLCSLSHSELKPVNLNEHANAAAWLYFKVIFGWLNCLKKCKAKFFLAGLPFILVILWINKSQLAHHLRLIFLFFPCLKCPQFFSTYSQFSLCEFIEWANVGASLSMVLVELMLAWPNRTCEFVEREEKKERKMAHRDLWTNHLLSNVPLLSVLFSPDAFFANYAIVQIRPISRSIYTRGESIFQLHF